MMTFLLGGAMAGIGGLLYVIFFEGPRYNVGFVLGIKAFTAAVLGGIGNLRGALLGGLSLGLIEEYGASIFGVPVEGRDRLRRPDRGADVPADRDPRRVPGEGTRMKYRRADRLDRRTVRASSDAADPRPVGERCPGGSAGSVYGLLCMPAALVAAEPITGLGDIMTPGTDWERRPVLSRSRIYVLLAIGLNIVVGYAGLLDLGFVAFFAIGAYTMAILGTELRLGVLAACRWRSSWPCSPACCSAAPTLRLRGDYLAIVTLGLRRDRPDHREQHRVASAGARGHQRHPAPAAVSSASTRYLLDSDSSRTTT